MLLMRAFCLVVVLYLSKGLVVFLCGIHADLQVMVGEGRLQQKRVAGSNKTWGSGSSLRRISHPWRPGEYCEQPPPLHHGAVNGQSPSAMHCLFCPWTSEVCFLWDERQLTRLAQTLHANGIFFLKCTLGPANNLGAKAHSEEDKSVAEKLSKCSSSVEELTGVPSLEHFLMGDES